MFYLSRILKINLVTLLAIGTWPNHQGFIENAEAASLRSPADASPEVARGGVPYRKLEASSEVTAENFKRMEDDFGRNRLTACPSFLVRLALSIMNEGEICIPRSEKRTQNMDNLSIDVCGDDGNLQERTFSVEYQQVKRRTGESLNDAILFTIEVQDDNKKHHFILPNNGFDNFSATYKDRDSLNGLLNDVLRNKGIINSPQACEEPAAEEDPPPAEASPEPVPVIPAPLETPTEVTPDTPSDDAPSETSELSSLQQCRKESRGEDRAYCLIGALASDEITDEREFRRLVSQLRRQINNMITHEDTASAALELIHEGINAISFAANSNDVITENLETRAIKQLEDIQRGYTVYRQGRQLQLQTQFVSQQLQSVAAEIFALEEAGQTDTLRYRILMNQYNNLANAGQQLQTVLGQADSHILPALSQADISPTVAQHFASPYDAVRMQLLSIPSNLEMNTVIGSGTGALNGRNASRNFRGQATSTRRPVHHSQRVPGVQQTGRGPSFTLDNANSIIGTGVDFNRSSQRGGQRMIRGRG